MENTDKYEKVTGILRNSKPVLPHPEILEEKVMERIRERKALKPFLFLDYVFGWVYIGWMRNGLVTASFLLVAFFAVQQTIILRRVNELEKQALYTGAGNIHAPLQDAKYVLYKSYNEKIQRNSDKITEREMKLIFESLNEIQSRYKALLNMIDENPELKIYIQDKLSDKDRKKFKI
jgi:hypothetical protein